MTETIPQFHSANFSHGKAMSDRPEPDKNIDELAASIAAHGLLQSLVVKQGQAGQISPVIAGTTTACWHSGLP